MTRPQRVKANVFTPNKKLRTPLGLVLVLGIMLLAPAASSATVDTSPTATHASLTEDTTAEEPVADGGTEETTIDPEEEANNELLRDGKDVYAAVCQSCHQPGGVGLPGQFPPLKGNANATDPAYVTDVIANGRTGKITVNGETYDGVMPSFSTLSTEDVAAVVAYVTNDLVAPEPVGAVITPTGPIAGTELPDFTNMTYYLSLALALFVALLVVGPRLTSQNDRLDTPWFDAGLKTATIVLGFIIGTVFIPNWALQTGTVSKLGRNLQDLIGTSLWIGGLGIGLWTLWYTHRESRI